MTTETEMPYMGYEREKGVKTYTYHSKSFKNPFKESLLAEIFNEL